VAVRERCSGGRPWALRDAERDGVSGALAAQKVSKAFAGLSALSSVDLAVAPGEIVGVIGPNGSGKTTLINVLSGVLSQNSGRVFIDGRDVSTWSAHRIARLGVARTFQNIRLFRGLSVLENVEVGAVTAVRRKGSLRREARSLLVRVGIADLAGREASTLPYGAQRRVELARALALRPRYLMLDEPAAGMNEAESDDLLGMIQAIRDQYGLGLVVVDHDLRLIMRLCERIVVLNNGRVISAGSPAQVQTDPAVIEAYLGARHTTRQRMAPTAPGTLEGGDHR
jgi:branched-chain amino acid transport system permease protein